MGKTLEPDLGLLAEATLRFDNQDAYPKLTHIASPCTDQLCHFPSY